MPFIDRRTSILTIAGALASVYLGPSAAQQPSQVQPNLEHVRLGDIVGAIFTPPRSFALLTRRLRPGDVTTELFVDDLVHLTRIALSGIQSWAFSLEFDNRSRYVIRYLASGQEAVVQQELNHSGLEARLLAADVFLKQAAYALDLPEDLALGASEVTLCQIELQDFLEGGGVPGTEEAGRFVLNFNLETEFEYPRELGLGFLFKNPRVVVRHGSRTAGVEAPKCVQRFVEILNRNLGRVLDHPGPLGDALRSMKAVMLVNEAIHWGLSVFIPVNAQTVGSFPTPRFDNKPPKVEQFRMLAGYDGAITGLAYEGGVRFGPAQTPPALARLARHATGTGTPQPPTTASDPGFVVSVPGDAEPWMRVDISSILGLGR